MPGRVISRVTYSDRGLRQLIFRTSSSSMSLSSDNINLADLGRSGFKRKRKSTNRSHSRSGGAPRFGPRAGAAALIRASTRSLYSRSEEHTSELQSLMRLSYAVFCLKQKK